MSNEIKNKMYLKVPYSILDWGWIHDPNTFLVYMHLMLLANRKPHDYMGDTINRGEILASYDFLAKQTGLSIQNVRTAIKHLKQTNTINHRKINGTNVFLLSDFEKNQLLGAPDNPMRATDGQSLNQATQPFFQN